jgi:hypothetical protein
MLGASQILERLCFDVDRLRDAALRLERVDEALLALRRHLEARARLLTKEATAHARPELSGSGRISIRYAQAHAVAHLARRAALGEVLKQGSYLPLIAAMATSRWVAALRNVSAAPRGEVALRSHIEAGRVAYRVLRSLRRKRGLVPGVGQLASAAVVAQFAHALDRPYVDEQLEEGLDRAARSSSALTDVEAALGAASLALREGACLLEELAKEAEPATEKLLEEADGLERRVELNLRQAGR